MKLSNSVPLLLARVPELQPTTAAPLPDHMPRPGGPRELSAWRELAAQECAIVYRGYPDTDRVQVLTALPLGENFSGNFITTAEVYCAVPNKVRAKPQGTGVTSCPGRTLPMALRTADFAENVSRFSVTVN